MKAVLNVGRAATECALSGRQPGPLHLIEPVADRIARFPSTRYYGSKRKLLNWMYGHLGSLRFETVLDAFGGTGSVSLLFQAMNKRVTYHDGFRFNEDVARTVLSRKLALTRPEVETALAKVQPTSGVIAENFDSIFFKAEENTWLDGFAALLSSTSLTTEASALLRYLVYQACLKKRPFNLFHRANLSLRTRDGVRRSFGNAATWERSFSHHALQAFDELSRVPSAGRQPAIILPAGDASKIKPGYDLVYIDPPYINRADRYNRDDYWRRYHFLEGLADYDKWASRIDPMSDIKLAQPSSWFFDWGRKANFKDRLFSFIDSHRHSIVALSYVSSAMPSESELLAYFEARFDQVSIHSAAHSHALSKTKKRELLLIGVPK
jgi:adenine-specific DNA-methyltransferase